MIIAQAREILRTWRECMNEAELFDSSDFSDRNASKVQYVPPTSIRIEEIVEEEPPVVYGPHPPSTVDLIDSKDERASEGKIDLTYQDHWIIDPKNTFS